MSELKQNQPCQFCRKIANISLAETEDSTVYAYCECGATSPAVDVGDYAEWDEHYDLHPQRQQIIDDTWNLRAPEAEPAQGQEPVFYAAKENIDSPNPNAFTLVSGIKDAEYTEPLYAQPQRANIETEGLRNSMRIIREMLHLPAESENGGNDLFDALQQRPAEFIEVDGLRVGEAWVRNKLEEQNQRPAVPDDDATVEYIAQYGATCRDCADNNDVCPTSGLPCGGRKKAIRWVLRALNYGLKHGFLTAAPAPERPKPDLHKIIMRYCADTMSMQECRNLRVDILEALGLSTDDA